MAENVCQNESVASVKKVDHKVETNNVPDSRNEMDLKSENTGKFLPNPGGSKAKVTGVNVSSNNKRNIQEKESFQRINYLFQAAQLMTAKVPKARSVPSYYCSLIHSIAQKSQIRLHPNVKRMMCRGCKCLLFPGINADVTVKSRPSCQVVWKCSLCRTIRRLPAKRGYKLWVERPEAIVSQ